MTYYGVNVINGAELMSETGSLRFLVGLNALASGYDANGNMTLRLKDGARYFLAYDAENRLTAVSGTVSASFVYNGDGQRVTATIGTTTTAYIGGYFEWQGGAGKSYYFAGAQRIAMRTSTGVKYLLGDHLGSTSVTALASGAFDTGTRYYPWGAVRWSSGPSPTDYMFTGQQEDSYINLVWMNSRWYDPELGRWTSPDSIIPDQSNPQSWDRYSYVFGNPIKFNDPSGHCPWCLVGALVGAAAGYGIQVYNNYQNGYTGSDAWTQNISAEPIIGGALIGAGAVIFAPAAVAAVGDVLVGAGVTTGSTACLGQGCRLMEHPRHWGTLSQVLRPLLQHLVLLPQKLQQVHQTLLEQRMVISSRFPAVPLDQLRLAGPVSNILEAVVVMV